jgi:hypothetical protein
MLTAIRAQQEIDGYCRRVEDLYSDAHKWIIARRPGGSVL